MNISEHLEELMARMGSITTDEQAARFAALLKRRGFITFSDLDELTDEEFNSLMQEALS